MAKKVLIIYAGAGQGHFSCAKSIKRVFEDKYPEIETGLFDVLNHPFKIYQKAFANGYDYLSGRLPFFWRLLYRFFNNQSRQGFAQLIFQWFFEKPLAALIGNFKPDFIIATHFLPTRLISFSKRGDLIKIPSGEVLTDYGCHSFWLDQETNYYFVATPELKKCLIGYGVGEEQITACGIPIEQKFSRARKTPQIVSKLGLRPGLFTFLIVGGQLKFSAVSELIADLEKKQAGKIQYLIVAGRDAEFEKAVKKSALNKLANVKTFGFISNLEELMAVSDIVFSKAGGLTVSECLAVGLPMLINKVIPGQEEDNVEFLIGQGAAVKVNNIREISRLIDELLARPEKLAAMKQAALRLGKPRAAETLVDFVYREITKVN